MNWVQSRKHFGLLIICIYGFRASPAAPHSGSLHVSKQCLEIKQNHPQVCPEWTSALQSSEYYPVLKISHEYILLETYFDHWAFYRDGDFADFSAFADFFQCFQSSAFLRISAVPSFNQREREMRKKCLQNNPNRASERNAEKLLTKNIPNRASALWTSELWASWAVRTFIFLTSGVLNDKQSCGIHFLHRCYFLLEVAR